MIEPDVTVKPVPARVNPVPTTLPLAPDSVIVAALIVPDVIVFALIDPSLMVRPLYPNCHPVLAAKVFDSIAPVALSTMILPPTPRLIVVAVRVDVLIELTSIVDVGIVPPSTVLLFPLIVSPVFERLNPDVPPAVYPVD